MKCFYSFIIILIIIGGFQLSINYDNTKSFEVVAENNPIDLKGTSILTKDNITTFKTTLINNKETAIYINYIEIIVKDSEKNTICTFKINIDKNIESNNHIKLEKEVAYDLSDATSFDYVIK